MNAIDVRMRCIEAVMQAGIRETTRTIREAAELERWVLEAAPDKADAPVSQDEPKARVGRPPKADKASAPA